MDFREHQDTAKSRSGRPLLLYAALLLLFCLLAAALISAAWLELFSEPPYYGYQPDTLQAVGDFFLSPSFGLSFLSLFGGILCMTALSPVSLSSGGRRVAESLHGALIPPQTREAGERRLINVVTEMALASGTPVPPVYILREEKSINAFAAGSTLQDAVIGVTGGAVRHLTRDELQAVVAHEFSHILNGDMRLNQRFARLLFGLMCLTQVGGGILRVMFRATSPLVRRHRVGSRRDQGNAGAVIIFLGIVAVVCYATGLVSSFFGAVIQAAITRQREYLADASSVQFTRSTALASALKKIGGLEAGSRLRAAGASPSYAHLFFCRIYGGPLSTHPPLRERILRLEPGWDGNFIQPGPLTDAVQASEEKSFSPSRERLLQKRGRADTDAAPALSPLARASQRKGKADAGSPVRPPQPGPAPATAPGSGQALGAAPGNGALLAVHTNMGLDAWLAQETPPEAKTGGENRESAPDESLRFEERTRRAAAAESLQALALACREPLDACRLMLALLLSPQAAIRKTQLAGSDAEERQTILAFRADIDRAPPEIFVPLIEMAVPALKNLSHGQLQTLVNRMRQYARADSRHSFEEWIVFQSISSLVGVQFAPRSGNPLPPGPGAIRDAATLLLSALAGVTLHADPAALPPDFGRTNRESDAGRTFGDERASGAVSSAAAGQALSAGLRIMRLPDAPLQPFPDQEQLEAAIALVGRTPSATCERFLRAALAVIAHDGGLELREIMFLQLLCLCLGQPVPAEAYQLPGAVLLPPEGRG